MIHSQATNKSYFLMASAAQGRRKTFKRRQWHGTWRFYEKYDTLRKNATRLKGELNKKILFHLFVAAIISMSTVKKVLKSDMGFTILWLLKVGNLGVLRDTGLRS